MAVALPTPALSEVKNTDATSHVTAATLTVVAGRLYVFTVASKTEITTDPVQPTITGAGLTIAVVPGGNHTVVYDNSSSSRRRETLFYAIAPANNSGALTVDYAGQTQVTMEIVVDEIATGFSPAVPILRSANNSSPVSNVSNLAATLPAFASPNNATYAAFASGNGTDTYTPGSGFSQVTSKKDTTENNLTILTEFKPTNDTSADVDMSPAQPEVGIIAIEIAASHNFNGNVKDFGNNIRPRAFAPGLAR